MCVCVRVCVCVCVCVCACVCVIVIKHVQVHTPVLLMRPGIGRNLRRYSTKVRLRFCVHKVFMVSEYALL